MGFQPQNHIRWSVGAAHAFVRVNDGNDDRMSDVRSMNTNDDCIFFGSLRTFDFNRQNRCKIRNSIFFLSSRMSAHVDSSRMSAHNKGDEFVEISKNEGHCQFSDC